MASDEEAKQALLRIEGLLRDYIDQQAALARRIESNTNRIRWMAEWCALAALVFLGRMVYEYFK